MNARYLLGIAIAVGTAVAACGGPDPSQLPGEQDDGETPTTPSGKTKAPPPITEGTTPPAGTPATPGNLPTNSAAGKAFYAANIQPVLDAKCSGCHVQGGIGNPSFLVKADANKSYEMLYAQAYVTATSRIVVKGVHSNGGAPELTAPEKSKWAEWIAIETKDGGQKTQTNVLEKFGTCFDKTKFDAIQFGQLRTIRRQNGNNPQNLNENANNCTGCDNAPCRTCHSADDVTGFVMAIGNPIFPPEYTFEQTKLLNPAYIRQYVSTSPTGEPQFNPALQAKSINTVEKAKAYEHPMYKLSATMQAAIQAFVDDAVAKQKAGTCGK